MPTLDDVHAVARDFLYMPDVVPLDVAIATVVANRRGGEPVWMNLVGPPSTTKTEIVTSFNALPEVQPLTKLTPRTLLSGLSGRRASLLYRMQDSSPPKTLLVLKDFTTVLDMPFQPRDEILGLLREVYDGQASLGFGTNVGTVEWEGRLGWLAGVTPVIDDLHSVLSTLGQRWLFTRHAEMSLLERKKTAKEAALHTNADGVRYALKEAVSMFVVELDVTREVPLTDELTDRVVELAALLTTARSVVKRERRTREIIQQPTFEGPARAMKALLGLYQALVVMDHTDPESVLRRVTFDSMPPARAKALTVLSQSPNIPVLSTDVRRTLRVSQNKARETLKDLEALGLVDNVTSGSGGTEGTDGGPGVAGTWRLSEDCWSMLRGAMRRLEPTRARDFEPVDV